MKKRIVYIAHPIGGDVKNNLERIKNIYADITNNEPDVVPFAPYWITCHALDDNNSIERAKGFEHNEAIFKSGIIDELWVYGISNGVEIEMGWAIELNIKIDIKI